MEKHIPEGYKQTEVGVIPVDWETKAIEEITIQGGIVRGPFGGSLKKNDFVKSGYKVYEQKNAIKCDVKLGSYYISNEKFIELKRFVVSSGDFIVSCSGTIGRIFQIPLHYEIGIINQALLKLTINSNKFSDKYFIHYFRWDRFQKFITDNTHGGAMKNLVGINDFKKASIPFPTRKAEQKAIATALSDVDNLITSLEQLIEKEKAIKQGIMQELLTGRRRLKGFGEGKGYKQTELGMIPEDWEVKTYDELFTFLPTATYSRAELKTSGEIGCIHYGDIHTKYEGFIDFDKTDTPKISKEQLKNYPFLKEGDVIIVDTSEDYLGVGKSIEVKNLRERKVISGLHTFLLREKVPSIVNGYKGYLQKVPAIIKQMNTLASGLKVYGVSRTNLKTILIPFPYCKNEQKAIAQFLYDMDSEIEKLEAKVDKYIQIKQGMMQNLLSGRIRLK